MATTTRIRGSLVAVGASMSLVLALTAPLAARPAAHPKKGFTIEFNQDGCTFANAGRNRYFVLEPGHELLLEGQTKRGLLEVRQTVLPETRFVDGVETRVVESVETLEGVVVEHSLSFLALCAETSTVVAFGEEALVLDPIGDPAASGSWFAGENGARRAVAMPGEFYLGARYHTQWAPGVAQDRAEHVAMGLTVETPAGTFENCVEVIETTPLEPHERTTMVYAEGIGLVVDDGVRLVQWRPAPSPLP